MIFAQDVCKNFGKFQALKNINFKIERGEIVGVLGQNGAGKTTLMRILTSYLLPSSGDILVSGKQVSKHSMFVREKIGYLPETPPLYFNMTVKDYLKYAAQLKGVVGREIKLELDRTLEECAIKDVQNRTIGNLSKGFKQRVGIAQAIINNPEIIILDEPTNGLDPLQILQVRSLIRNLEENRTVIISTHVLSEIEQLAKRVIILKAGTIIADQSLSSLQNFHGDKERILISIKGEKKKIEQAIADTNGLIQMDIVSSGDVHSFEIELTEQLEDLNELAQNILNSNGQILEMKAIKQSLENVFLRVNAREGDQD